MLYCIYLQLLGAAWLTCTVGSVYINGTDEVLSQGSLPETDIFGSNHSLTGGEHGFSNSGIHIVSFKWQHVETPYLIVLWILVAGVAKMGM